MNAVVRKPKSRHFMAELAVQWIIASPTATYRQAADRYNVSIHRIRARINNRYGSLAAARVDQSARRTKINGKRQWARPCISCGVTDKRDFGQYRCDKCLSGDSEIFDGVV